MNSNVYATSTLQTKQSGQIEGKIVWNNHWNKFQVSVNGEPTGEFKTKEDAIEELKNNGFKNIKINNQFIQENTKIPTKRQIQIVENFIKTETKRLMKEENRIEDIANTQDLNQFKTKFRLLVADWKNEGFDNYDIIQYLKKLLNEF